MQRQSNVLPVMPKRLNDEQNVRGCQVQCAVLTSRALTAKRLLSKATKPQLRFRNGSRLETVVRVGAECFLKSEARG